MAVADTGGISFLDALHGRVEDILDNCTRCGDSPFFSHRGGRAERQVAFLGVR